MTVQEWLGEDSQLSLDIWHKKYQYNNESFDKWLDRVSNHNENIKQLIIEKKFLFGGRILANRGINDRKVTYSNCYVITPPEDNIESIFECASKLARTFSYGGGCGIDLSKLRPKGARTNNAAKESTGPVSFMDIYSQVTGTISQNGRRGALMISLDISHPDVEEFIDCKTNLDKVTYANISVKVNDEFMKAVENDEYYVLHWPCGITQSEFDRKVGEVGKLEFDEAYGIYTKRIKAKELFNKLVKNNWDYAEPGILYWDKVKSYNMLDNTDFEYAGVNPCLTGDTLIQTVEGEIQIKDLVGTTPFVYCMDNSGRLSIRKAIKVWKTRENANLVEVITGKGKLTCTPDHRIYTSNRGWVKAIDLQHGDKIKGLNRQTTGHKYCSVGLSGSSYEKEHRFIARHFSDINGMDVHHINDNGFDNRLSNLEVITHEEHSKLSNTGRYIEVNRDINTGQYLSKEERTSRVCRNLGKQVGTNWFVYEVKDLNYTEDVYDMTVEDTHNFIANGFVVHNCAEEPLPAGGSCCLGSVNVSQFVTNPFTKNAQFDYDAFEDAVTYAVQGLNQVLMEGLSLHPLEEQQNSVGNYRQVGLGTFGLADCLIQMGLKYGDEEANKFIDFLYHEMAKIAVLTSLQLAKTEGCYPMCDKEKLSESSFIKALELPKRTIDEIKKYGLFNSQLLTCAPTGTIGTMLETSTGVEPNFAFKYFRKTVSLNKEETFYEVDSKIVKDYKKATGEENLPDYFVQSSEIDPIDRVKVQSILQKYIDASISSTVNLKKEATVEDVSNIYLEAWRQGLKGITIYRSGCKREGILVTEKKEDLFPITKAPKRPKELPADLYTVKVKGETFIVLVGLLNGKPYEIFTFRPNIDINVNNHKGVIVKKSKMHYMFKSDILTITELELANDNIEEKAATLYSSMLLRHGVDIKYIIKTAKKVNNNITSFSSAMCRVLSKYIPDEVLDEKCPECGANLVRTGGCVQCPSCGWSRCG